MMWLYRTAHVLKRAVGGARRRPWLHAASLLTLTAAFLSFGATFTVALNMDAWLDRSARMSELTVYLEDGATDADLARLADAVLALPGVARVDPLSAARAKERFAAGLGDLGDLAGTLPETVFPLSLDVYLKEGPSHSTAERKALAARLGQVDIVGEVDLYDEWFERLGAVSLLGRLAAFGLGALALLVAILVVGTVVRSGVTARSREVELLGLMGASDGYVRLPFLLEGCLMALVAMALSIGALHFATNSVDRLVGDLLPLVGVASLVRLGPTGIAALLVGAALAGLAGSKLSLGRLEKA